MHKLRDHDPKKDCNAEGKVTWFKDKESLRDVG
jgi:hypothetical protein